MAPDCPRVSNLVRGGAPVALDLMLICRRVSRAVQQSADVELLCCDDSGTLCTVKVPGLAAVAHADVFNTAFKVFNFSRVTVMYAMGLEKKLKLDELGEMELADEQFSLPRGSWMSPGQVNGVFRHFRQ